MAALRERKVREREGAFLVEGADLVLAGLAAGLRPQLVFRRAAAAVDDEVLARVAGAAPAAAGAAPATAVFAVSDRVAARLATLETPADLMAVFPLPAPQPLSRLAEAGPDALVVYADGLQDPGNLGTLLRAAAAFGAAALVTAPGSADLYNPKTLRASAGAAFALRLWRDVPLARVAAALPGAAVVGLAAHGGEPLPAADLPRPALLVVGAERRGLSPEAEELLTRRVTIPLAPARAGAVESLNAGVAGAIALYELACRARAGAAGAGAGRRRKG